MHILHVVNVDKENYYLRNLAEYSDPEKVEYSFVTLADDGCDFVADLRANGWEAWGLSLIGRKNLPKAYREIKKIFVERKPDIVHVHLFEPSLIGLRAAKKLGIKTVLTRHHSDALHKLPFSLKRKFYLSLENYISRNSDHIIAPSRTVREYLVEHEGVPPEKVSIIPYGQTTERFDAVTPEKIESVRKELGMGEGLNLVNVSRLYHRKGHKDLLAAFAKLRYEDGIDATLYLVGDGDVPFETEVRELAKSLGIADSVKFLLWRDDALAVVAAADIVVHPSLEDALSSAVIEALMLEKPIVATDISGVRDSLDDGKYGKIVPPSDPDALRLAVLEVINSLNSARRTASEGRKFLLDYMDARRVGKEHESLYYNLLRSGNE